MDVSHVYKGLFLGSRNALDGPKLSSAGIFNIINTARELTEGSYNIDWNMISRCGITVNHLKWDDNDKQVIYPMSPEILSAINQIHECIEQGKYILVVCLMGISRSTTMVLSYLVYKVNMPLSEALSLVKKARPIVSPNLSFLNQLTSLEYSLRQSSSPPLSTVQAVEPNGAPTYILPAPVSLSASTPTSQSTTQQNPIPYYQNTEILAVSPKPTTNPSYLTLVNVQNYRKGALDDASTYYNSIYYNNYWANYGSPTYNNGYLYGTNYNGIALSRQYATQNLANKYQPFYAVPNNYQNIRTENASNTNTTTNNNNTHTNKTPSPAITRKSSLTGNSSQPTPQPLPNPAASVAPKYSLNYSSPALSNSSSLYQSTAPTYIINTNNSYNTQTPQNAPYYQWPYTSTNNTNNYQVASPPISSYNNANLQNSSWDTYSRYPATTHLFPANIYSQNRIYYGKY